MVKKSVFCRFFALFMALCLVIGMVPMNVLATEVLSNTGEAEVSVEENEPPKAETELPKVETEPSDEVTEPSMEVTEATEEETEATEEVTEATEKVTEATEEVTEATEEVIEATEEVTEATEEVTEPTMEELSEEDMALMMAIERGIPIDGTDYVVTSRKAYSVAPDVTEWSITTNTTDRQRQTVAQVLEVNVNNGYAKLAGGYGYRDPASQGWVMKPLTDQAHLYEKTYNENVVGGVNASLFDITNGKPLGYLVLKGTTYNNDASRPWIGVFSDNSVGLFSAGVTLEQGVAQQREERGADVELLDAISGWVDLVKDGAVADTGSNPGHYPRTVIGMTDDGTVMLMQADGMQAPRSEGYSIEESARLMQALGCVRAISLDEGGSSTIISQREGEDDLSLRNIPAGGGERTISTSILVVSTTPSD